MLTAAKAKSIADIKIGNYADPDVMLRIALRDAKDSTKTLLSAIDYLEKSTN